MSQFEEQHAALLLARQTQLMNDQQSNSTKWDAFHESDAHNLQQRLTALRNNMLRKPTIVLATAATIWRAMHAYTQLLDMCTHLIIDEVHQRSLDGDLLYSAVRLATSIRNGVSNTNAVEVCEQHQRVRNKVAPAVDASFAGPRLITMSAYYDGEMFAQFFCAGLHRAPSVLGVADTTHRNINVLHLSELIKEFAVAARSSSANDVRSFDRKNTLANDIRDLSDKTTTQFYYESNPMMKKLINSIVVELCMKTSICGVDVNKPNTRTLVFLPSLDNVNAVELQELLKLKGINAILLDGDDAIEKESNLKRDFAQRRVLLCDRRMESCVTLVRTVLVIDTGRASMIEFDHDLMIDRVSYRFVSRSSATQRKGRTGRDVDGVCVRLYEEADLLSTHDRAEVRRISLPRALVRLKTLASSASPFATSTTANPLNNPLNNVIGVLSNTIDPPPLFALSKVSRKT
jgi:ATP-dependent RNA helicase DHX57